MQRSYGTVRYIIVRYSTVQYSTVLPPERAPKVLAPSLFFLHSYSIIIALANGLGNKFEFEISFYQLFYTCYIHNIHVYTSQCRAPQGPTYLKNHSLVPVSLSLIHYITNSITICTIQNINTSLNFFSITFSETKEV